MLAPTLHSLSAGEMLVGPQRVLLLDEISTGLDASTTRLLTIALGNLTHLSQVCAVDCVDRHYLSLPFTLD